MAQAKGISINPEIMGGQPCIAATRIPVSCIASFASEGVATIKREYPGISARQIADALAQAITDLTTELTQARAEIARLEEIIDTHDRMKTQIGAKP